MIFKDARAAFFKACTEADQMREAIEANEAKQRECDKLFLAMKAVCPHSEGFQWNGLGSRDGSNQQCSVCGTYKSAASAGDGGTK